ncbi:unnamed protein product [Prorocentrum cordatum]|uniref:Reverse transcriptase domain-containing protein n=1 Tax=Prorocentrum cordatum TaxID=2364126 RepID=A0ABN9TMG0_9DINO|nr:unnamed protein product [Polarella glacialis]
MHKVARCNAISAVPQLVSPGSDRPERPSMAAIGGGAGAADGLAAARAAVAARRQRAGDAEQARGEVPARRRVQPRGLPREASAPAAAAAAGDAAMPQAAGQLALPDPAAPAPAGRLALPAPAAPRAAAAAAGAAGGAPAAAPAPAAPGGGAARPAGKGGAKGGRRRGGGGGGQGAGGGKGKGHGGKGRGAGRGRGLPGPMEEVVEALVALGISHERELNMHTDRVGALVVLKDEELIDEVWELRSAWRQADKDRKEQQPADGPLPPHPMGSQRSMLFKAICEWTAGKLQEADPGKQAATDLAAMPAAEVDASLFRFKPRHEAVTVPGVRFGVLHTDDGPIVQLAPGAARLCGPPGTPGPAPTGARAGLHGRLGGAGGGPRQTHAAARRQGIYDAAVGVAWVQAFLVALLVTIGMIKAAGEPVLAEVRRLVRLFWGIPNEQWADVLGQEPLRAVVILLFKNKCSLSYLDNYRGICLLSMLSRIVAKVAATRVSKWAEASGFHVREQWGNRKYHSTRDAVLVMRILFEESTRVGTMVSDGSLAAVLVDVKKAFPNVPRALCWKVLTRLGVPPAMLNVLRGVHEQTFYVVRTGAGDASPYVLQRGLREGCPTSGILYTVFHNVVLWRLREELRDEQKVHLHFNRARPLPRATEQPDERDLTAFVAHLLAFADDTTMLTRKQHARAVEDMVIRIMGRFGETVHPGKTERLCAAAKGEAAPPGFLTAVRLLGAWFVTDGGTEQDDTKRLQAARLVWRRLHKQLPRLRLSSRLRGSVVQATVVASLLYACEVRPFTPASLRAYQLFINRVIRGITYDPKRGGTRAMEGVCTTVDLRIEAGIDAVPVQVLRRQLGYLGHLARYPGDRLEQHMLGLWLAPQPEGDGAVDAGARAARTPSLRDTYWKLIVRVMGLTGLPEEEWSTRWVEVAQDRPEWRRLSDILVHYERQRWDADAWANRHSESATAYRAELQGAQCDPFTGERQCPRCGVWYVKLGNHMRLCDGTPPARVVPRIVNGQAAGSRPARPPQAADAAERHVRRHQPPPPPAPAVPAQRRRLRGKQSPPAAPAPVAAPIADAAYAAGGAGGRGCWHGRRHGLEPPAQAAAAAGGLAAARAAVAQARQRGEDDAAQGRGQAEAPRRRVRGRQGEPAAAAAAGDAAHAPAQRQRGPRGRPRLPSRRLPVALRMLLRLAPLLAAPLLPAAEEAAAAGPLAQAAARATAAAVAEAAAGTEAAAPQAAEVVEALVTLGISHERGLNMHTDRVGSMVVLRDEDLVNEVWDLRDEWRRADRARKEALPADANGPLPAHPMGSQRSMLFAAVCEAAAGKLQAGTPGHAAATQLAQTAPAELDSQLFRFKPRHEEPMAGRPWVWYIVYSIRVAPGFLDALASLQAANMEGLRFGVLHTDDGPIVQWLRRQR